MTKLHKKTDQSSELSVIQLLMQGRFAELEKICINNPSLREILLHWRGVRGSSFFKRRLRFYRNFAKKSGLRKFTPEAKNQLRDEFAREHCLKTTLRRVKEATLKGYDSAALTCDKGRIQFKRMLRRRRRRLGL